MSLVIWLNGIVRWSGSNADVQFPPVWKESQLGCDGGDGGCVVGDGVVATVVGAMVVATPTVVGASVALGGAVVLVNKMVLLPLVVGLVVAFVITVPAAGTVLLLVACNSRRMELTWKPPAGKCNVPSVLAVTF